MSENKSKYDVYIVGGRCYIGIKILIGSQPQRENLVHFAYLVRGIDPHKLATDGFPDIYAGKGVPYLYNQSGSQLMVVALDETVFNEPYTSISMSEKAILSVQRLVEMERSKKEETLE
jgi:hypothetical protein